MILFSITILFTYEEQHVEAKTTIRVACWNRGGRFEKGYNNMVTGYDIPLSRLSRVDRFG